MSAGARTAVQLLAFSSVGYGCLATSGIPHLFSVHSRVRDGLPSPLGYLWGSAQERGVESGHPEVKIHTRCPVCGCVTPTACRGFVEARKVVLTSLLSRGVKAQRCVEHGNSEQGLIA